MQIRTRVTSFTAAALALAGAAMLGVVVCSQSRAFRTSFERMAERDIRLLAEITAERLADTLKNGDLEELRRLASVRQREGVRVTIINASGGVVFDTATERRDDHSRRDEIRQSWAAGESVVVRHSDTLGVYMLYAARKVGDYVIRLAVPYREVMEPVRRTRLGLAISSVVGLLVAFAVFALTLRLSRRIDALAAERDAQRLKLEEANRMEQFRREFVENVSHEIKTPLAGVIGAVEMLVNGTTIDDSERGTLLAIAQKESGRIESLVGDILCLAELEHTAASGLPNNLPPCDIGLIVNATVDRYQRKADHEGVLIRRAIQDGLIVHADREKIDAAVGNLISNALKYGNGGDIEITVRAVEGHVEIAVRDKGPGIPAEHLPRLFERFYRIDKARSRALGGTGLGLAIVKHTAILHGGKARCESTLGRGSTFTLEIPCASS